MFQWYFCLAVTRVAFFDRSCEMVVSLTILWRNAPTVVIWKVFRRPPGVQKGAPDVLYVDTDWRRFVSVTIVERKTGTENWRSFCIFCQLWIPQTSKRFVEFFGWATSLGRNIVCWEEKLLELGQQSQMKRKVCKKICNHVSRTNIDEFIIAGVIWLWKDCYEVVKQQSKPGQSAGKAVRHSKTVEEPPSSIHHILVWPVKWATNSAKSDPTWDLWMNFQV